MMRRVSVLRAAPRGMFGAPRNAAPSTLSRVLAGFVASALIAVLAAATFAFGAPTAHAAVPSDIDLSADTTLALTKLEQPQTMGQAANGLPIADLSAYTPIDGVQFAVTEVPLDTPLNTATGWQQAASMTVSDAITRIGSATPNATGTTSSAGVTEFDSLGVGLFLVTETAAPAGVVAGAPFLVALPIPHPTVADDWLYDVYAYPKNARVSITLDVIDRDAYTIDGAPSPANTVSWAANADIPRQDIIDGYRVVNEVDPSLQFLATPPGSTPTMYPDGVRVMLSGNSGVTLDPADYDLITPSGPGGEVIVTVLPSGLAKLAQAKAVDGDSQVRVDYVTQVLAEGALQNRALLCANAACIAGGPGAPGAVSDTAVTKWGPLKILVHEVGKPANVIPGAKFKLYLSEADARSGSNPISAGGATEWASDAQGRITVPGLRFSDFVDGAPRAVGDPLYRSYWAVLTHVPTGWQGSTAPIPMSVVTTSTSEAQLAIVELYRTGGGGLPNTGADSMAGIAIAALALLLGGAGVLILVTKRRKDKRGETHEQAVDAATGSDASAE